MAEIETVIVTFEEFKENLDHYLNLEEDIRLVVTHDGEEIAAIGPLIPGEERLFPQRWFFDRLFPPEPIDHENTASRALEEQREERTFT